MKEENQKIVKIFLIIIVVLIAGYFFYQKANFLNTGLKKGFKTTEFSVLLSKQNPNLEIPEKFPKNLPIVEGNLLEAYTQNQETKDITTIFESKKSAKENFDFYLDYAKKNEFTIDESREMASGTPAKILLRKNEIIVSLVIEEKEGGSKITISSTSLYKAKEKIDVKSLKL